MKGLLHSKRFKVLLKKWLCMYVGVMLLFTTVVTYSKYVTSKTTNDSARVTKFNVKITKTNDKMVACNECVKSATENCTGCSFGDDIDKYLPTSIIKYYFTLDSSEIEVRTDMLFYIYENTGNFNILKVKNITTDAVKYENLNPSSSVNFATFNEEVGADEFAFPYLYEISIQYKPNTLSLIEDLDSNIIQIGYKATQITGGKS